MLLVPRRGSEGLEELLPHLRRAIHARTDDGWADAVVRDLLARTDLSPAILSTLAQWQGEGESIPLTPEAAGSLVARLADPDPAARAHARELLEKAARQGVKILPTLPHLVVALRPSLPSLYSGKTVPELIEALLDTDGDFGLLLQWLALLAEDDPARAVAWLEDVLECGQDISPAHEALKRLGTHARDAALRQRAISLRRRKTGDAAPGARRLARMAAGLLSVGSGPTTDSQSVLYGENGKFFRGGPGDESPREVSKKRALAVLSRKQYQWSSSREPRPPKK
jgi:hypothetical protein